MSSTSTALLFERNGEPADVLQLHDQQHLPSLKDTDITVEILSVSCASSIGLNSCIRASALIYCGGSNCITDLPIPQATNQYECLCLIAAADGLAVVFHQSLLGHA